MAIDFRGNAFSVNGNDHDADGVLTTNDPLYGIATNPGTTAGDNEAAILAQIPSRVYDQIQGLDGTSSAPSVGETSESVDLDSLASGLASIADNELAPGTYSDLSSGDYSTGNIPITHIDGDLRLTGSGSGAGVLIVDGGFTVSGSFSWTGLVIVRGDITLTGGGAVINVLGSLMVAESINAIDSTDLTINGRADIFYSSEVLTTIQSSLDTNAGSYESVYYSDD